MRSERTYRWPELACTVAPSDTSGSKHPLPTAYEVLHTAEHTIYGLWVDLKVFRPLMLLDDPISPEFAVERKIFSSFLEALNPVTAKQ